MKYDQDLVDKLTAFKTERFDGEVFRATSENADPTAPSLYGGRWAWPQNSDPGTNVLYTSLERDGALAEVISFLADLTPIPGPRNIKVTRLAVSTSKTIRLARANLVELGVDMARFGERDYARTQKIGSTLAWLGLDGLITLSARWDCQNLMLFTDNHLANEKLDPIDHELVEWRQWAEANGILDPTGK